MSLHRLASLRLAWQFTEAQGRVLGMLVHGLTNKEIAHALGITEATIEAHVTQLLRRSGHENRTALTRAYWTHR